MASWSSWCEATKKLVQYLGCAAQPGGAAVPAHMKYSETHCMQSLLQRGAVLKHAELSVLMEAHLQTTDSSSTALNRSVGLCLPFKNDCYTLLERTRRQRFQFPAQGHKQGSLLVPAEFSQSSLCDIGSYNRRRSENTQPNRKQVAVLLYAPLFTTRIKG